MARKQLSSVLRHIRKLVGVHATPGLTDGTLLQRFASAGEEGAFAELVQRHGRLVLNVCRNVLHHEQDAEDAFQATFLVLARKAASIRKRESVASWLYGVAQRVALKARTAAAQRRVHEKEVGKMPRREPSAGWALRELQAVLDEEVGRLPKKYRDPFVLSAWRARASPRPPKSWAGKKARCPEGWPRLANCCKNG